MGDCSDESHHLSPSPSLVIVGVLVPTSPPFSPSPLAGRQQRAPSVPKLGHATTGTGVPSSNLPLLVVLINDTMLRPMVGLFP